MTELRGIHIGELFSILRTLLIGNDAPPTFLPNIDTYREERKDKVLLVAGVYA
jgi:hypothetical protein